MLPPLVFEAGVLAGSSAPIPTDCIGAGTIGTAGSVGGYMKLKSGSYPFISGTVDGAGGVTVAFVGAIGGAAAVVAVEAVCSMAAICPSSSASHQLQPH